MFNRPTHDLQRGLHPRAVHSWQHETLGQRPIPSVPVHPGQHHTEIAQIGNRASNVVRMIPGYLVPLDPVEKSTVDALTFDVNLRDQAPLPVRDRLLDGQVCVLGERIEPLSVRTPAHPLDP